MTIQREWITRKEAVRILCDEYAPIAVRTLRRVEFPTKRIGRNVMLLQSAVRRFGEERLQAAPTIMRKI